MKKIMKKHKIPIKWGHFADDLGDIHVIPVYKDKNEWKKCTNHVLHDFCICEPEVEMLDNGRLIITHNEINFN